MSVDPSSFSDAPSKFEYILAVLQIEVDKVFNTL